MRRRMRSFMALPRELDLSPAVVEEAVDKTVQQIAEAEKRFKPEEIGYIRMTPRKPAPSVRRPQAFALFVAGLFFFSGFAALVYQVTWMRHLSLFFGSDVYSVAITLSVFMGGLSLGSYIAERVEDRVHAAAAFLRPDRDPHRSLRAVFHRSAGGFHAAAQANV